MEPQFVMTEIVMTQNRTRFIRVTLLQLLFLIGLFANFIFLGKVRLIPRPLHENSLSDLSYGSLPDNRFVTAAIYDTYSDAESIFISQVVMDKLQIDQEDLNRIARIDTVIVISQGQLDMLEQPRSEAVEEAIMYPLSGVLKVVFLPTLPNVETVSVGVAVQGDLIVFFPMEEE